MAVFQRQIVLLILGAVAVYLLCSTAIGHQAKKVSVRFENWGDLVAVAVSDKPQNPLTAKLGNGSVANTLLWPATFSTTFKVGNREFICTAQLLGPRVLITAAHCVGDTREVTLQKQGFPSYKGKCTRDERYKTDISADFALCHIDNTDAIIPGRYEELDFDPGHVKSGVLVTAVGYGCTRPFGDSDGNFRTGPMILRGSAGARYPNYVLAIVPPAEHTYTFLCDGDSGGGGFLPAGVRRLVLINSTMLVDMAGNRVSYMSAISSAEGNRFIRNWVDHNGKEACGISHPRIGICQTDP